MSLLRPDVRHSFAYGIFYHTIVAHRVPNYPINTDSIPGQISTSTIQAILFGKLAVATEHQGRKIGRFLLYSAMYDSQVIADRCGVEVLIVDALKETGATNFYAKYGFRQRNLPDQGRTLPMYLTMEYIRSLGLNFP